MVGRGRTACDPCYQAKLRCDRSPQFKCCRRCTKHNIDPKDPIVAPTPVQTAHRRRMTMMWSNVAKTEENLAIEMEIEQVVQRNFILWRSNPGFEHPFAHHAFLKKYPDLYFSTVVATLPVQLAEGTDPNYSSERRQLGPKCFSRALICDFLLRTGHPLMKSDCCYDDFVWRPTVDVGDGQFILTRIFYPLPEYSLLRVWCTSVPSLLEDDAYASVLIQTTTAKSVYGSKPVSVLQEYLEPYVCLSSACVSNEAQA